MKNPLGWIKPLLLRSERFRIWSHERYLARLRRDYTREMAEARKPGSGADLQEIESRYSFEASFAGCRYHFAFRFVAEGGSPAVSMWVDAAERERVWRECKRLVGWLAKYKSLSG